MKYKIGLDKASYKAYNQSVIKKLSERSATMMKFKGMKVDEAVKTLEEMGVAFEVEKYADVDEVLGIMVGDYYGDHVDLEVEDGVVVYVDFCEWE